MDTYTHKPIDLSRKAIRQLRLLQGDREDRVECELFQSFLEEGQDVHVEYEALSYTWSDTLAEGDNPVEAPKSNDIFIDGLHFPVTSNLHMALKHLRLCDSDRILWVDAICIDQDKNEEKNHQVGQMSIVYSSAQNVIIWLGPGSPAISWLFYASTTLHQHAVRRCPVKGQTSLERWRAVWRSLDQLAEGNVRLVTEQSYDALKTVLLRPWFRRAWVIQEVALAKRATVVCGWSSTPASSFALMPGLLQVEVSERTQAVLDVMPGPLRNGENSWWKEKRDLSTILQKFGSSASSRAHDRIYALLGISSDHQAIKPKYGEAEEKVVEDVLKFLVLGTDTAPPGITFPMWSVDELINNLCPSDRLEGDGLNQRLLLWAARNGEMGLAGYLLERQSRLVISAGAQGEPQPILHLLAKTAGSQDLVKSFTRRNSVYLDFNCRFGSPNETALQCAVRHGHLVVADALLEAQDFALDRLQALSMQDCRDLDLERFLDHVLESTFSGPGTNMDITFSPATAKDLALKRLERDEVMYLETAARNGRASDLEFLLSRMPAIRPPSAMALRLAIESGSESSVEVLIEHGADVNEPSGLWTPLQLAVVRNEAAITKLLLKHNADPNRGFPLHLAVQHATPDIASSLIAAGAAIDAVRNRQTPLQIAVEGNNVDMASLLLGTEGSNNLKMLAPGAQDNCPSEETSLGVAANVSRDMAQYISRALRTAIASGHVRMATLLLQHQADQSGLHGRGDNDYMAGALRYAVSLGYCEAVDILIKHGADPNTAQWSDEGPNLWVAASRGYTSAAKAILENPPPGFDINAGSRITKTTPLWKAANRGDEDLVRELLRRGADIEAQDRGNATPLWAAANKGHVSTVFVLAAAGANTEARAMPFTDGKLNAFGHTTPSQIATARGFYEVARILSSIWKKRREADDMKPVPAKWYLPGKS
ncbi:hypothetical protein MAPG_07223 [Magnaporthiopsis poae ATCC 64411]|uniref:Heterokaryon incompatibility domain-containing protein n=1 Tax=Magnaporthiopsis poae (strain ATCC 64411 / 73-15) TaxID=644358 RepID=A0A0C4E435_MAGP6|nr:hypothetical protein MAPG_07223 [Magnaporthiopsis poae ATCC 64411]